MGLFDRLFRRAETRAATMADPSWSALSNGGAGMPAVTARTAENLAAVLACVNAISRAVASLPVYVYRRDGRGRTELTDHPVVRLIRYPNDWQTWPDMVEWMLASALLHGNALLNIQHDGAGRPVALVPVPWPMCSPVMLPSGRLALDVTQHSVPWGGTGQSRRIFADEAVWMKDRCDDGRVGRSRLSRCGDVPANAAALQQWSGSVWTNAAMPSGVYSVKGTLDEKQHAMLNAWIAQNLVGSRHAHKPLLLDREATFVPLSVTPEDAQVLASRRFAVEEICRLFDVPPPIVQDLSHGTFTNSREAGRWFAQFTLAPWIRKIEAAFCRSVIADPAVSIEIDMSALMRGDAEARWQSHKIAVEAGILDADEVRELEGWAPRGAKTEAGVG